MAEEVDPHGGPTSPDPLLRWAVQHPGDGARAFVRGAAAAVAAPGLSGRDRLAVPALVVDDANRAAVRLCRSLHLASRPLAAAAPEAGGQEGP